MLPRLRTLAYCVTVAMTTITASIATTATAAFTLTASNAHAQTTPVSIATTTVLDAPAITGAAPGVAFNPYTTPGAVIPTAGQSVALVATVKPQTGTSVVSGSVTFKDGSAVLGTAALDSKGIARINATLPTAGLRSLTASYAATTTATAAYKASTSAPLGIPVLGAAGALPAAPASTAQEVNYAYDASDNLTSLTNAPGNANLAQTTTLDYDRLNRPVVITDPAQGNTQVEYSASQTPLVIQDPRGLVTHYAGDTLGQPASLQSPDSGTTGYRYDSAGNLTQRTDARGLVSTYTYDALNRLTQVRYVPPVNSLSGSNTTPAAITRSWVYDQTAANTAGFSTYGIGRLTSQTYPAGQTSYAYDPQGRLIARRQTLQPIPGNAAAQPGAITSTVRYSYNSAGKVTSLTYPSGRVLNITYANGLPSALNITAPAGAVTPVVSGLTYTPDGQAQDWLWHLQTGTQKHQRSFDQQGRLNRLPLGNLVRDIRYDAAGRISQFNHYAVASTSNTGSPSTAGRYAALDHSYTYDSLGRITKANISSADAPATTTTYTYQWDANGNRTSQTASANPPVATLPKASTRQLTTAANSNQLQTLTNPAASLSYNQAGLLTKDSTGFNLEYDASDSFSSLGTVRTPDGQRTSYHYDNDALRVRKINTGTATTSANPSTTRIFVYDTSPDGEGVTGSYPRLLGEYDGNGNAVREYVWLGDMPVALLPGAAGTTSTATTTKVYPIHADHLNTPRVVLDEQGRTRWVWSGEPFGASAPEENPQGLGAIEQPLRFAGQYADKETGLFVNHYRYYSPNLGRYVQTDPIGLEGGVNTFAYVNGDPVSFVDPYGLVELGQMIRRPNQSLGAAQFSYNPNDVRGGFDTDGRSLVYNPKYYDPEAAAKALATGVLMIAPELLLAGRAGWGVCSAKGLNIADFAEVGALISNKQLRHIAGRPELAARGGGSFLDSMADAQAVLDAYRSGSATILGRSSQGFPVVRVNGISGTNVNIGAGIANQPTNVFIIKGTAHPSVVPTNPNWTPR